VAKSWRAEYLPSTNTTGEPASVFEDELCAPYAPLHRAINRNDGQKNALLTVLASTRADKLHDFFDVFEDLPRSTAELIDLLVPGSAEIDDDW
jgi:hypothetical protein